MNYAIVFIVFLCCFCLLGIGILLTGKILKKHCASDPTQTCSCQSHAHDKEEEIS